MYKRDLALKNLQWLIYHQTKPNQTNPINTKSLSFLKVCNLLCAFDVICPVNCAKNMLIVCSVKKKKESEGLR